MQRGVKARQHDVDALAGERRGNVEGTPNQKHLSRDREPKVVYGLSAISLTKRSIVSPAVSTVRSRRFVSDAWPFFRSGQVFFPVSLAVSWRPLIDLWRTSQGMEIRFHLIHGLLFYEHNECRHSNVSIEEVSGGVASDAARQCERPSNSSADSPVIRPLPNATIRRLGNWDEVGSFRSGVTTPQDKFCAKRGGRLSLYS